MQRHPRLVAVRGEQAPVSQHGVARKAASEPDGKASGTTGGAMPAALIAIWLTVFVQSLGEGIAISSLPLHLTSLGATPVQVGMSTSCFSVAQLVCCPLIVRWSGRTGRLAMLRICLLGAAVANLLIAAANRPVGVILARFCSGVFAASVPVAQSAVTDVVDKKHAVTALSRVSSAAQMGIVVGPLASAAMAGVFSCLGIPSHLTVRAVFATSAVLATFVFILSQATQKGGQAAAAAGKDPAGALSKKAGDGSPMVLPPKVAQPFLRLCAMAAGWSLTLSVMGYCLFGARFLGYGQPQLSTTFSAGATVTVLTQFFLVPLLVRVIGAHQACAFGLLSIACGLGGCSIVRSQPAHTILYMLNRVGSGVTDTSVATLVAATSAGDTDRAKNFALIQSTRAATRIVSPVLTGRLFEYSCAHSIGAPGALPFLIASGVAATCSPLPMVLKASTREPEAQPESDVESGADEGQGA